MSSFLLKFSLSFIHEELLSPVTVEAALFNRKQMLADLNILTSNSDTFVDKSKNKKERNEYSLTRTIVVSLSMKIRTDNDNCCVKSE